MLEFILLRAFLLITLLGLCCAAPLATITLSASASLAAASSTTATATSTSTVEINTVNISPNGTLLSTGLENIVLSNTTKLNMVQRKLASTTVYRPTVPYFAGFNVGAYKDNGACKTLDDWVTEFRKIKSWDNSKFTWTVAKIFTTSQCNALPNAISAAKTVGGIKIWAGIWAQPVAVYNADKAALEQQILAGNAAYIKGVSVGSEEMYRGTSAATLSGWIWDVKGMVQNAYGMTSIPVGTSDGIGALLNAANQAVLDACDVIMFTDYPYYGGLQYLTGVTAFKNDYNTLKGKMNGRAVIVGETGWPTKGPQIGAGVPSTYGAGRYFCKLAGWFLKNKLPFVWFESTNESWKTTTSGNVAEGQFGVSFSNNGPLKFALKSC